MITKTIMVTQLVEVTIDESKLTPEWMREYRENFYPFVVIDQHLEHLAQLAAREVIDQPQLTNQFIEGYGNANDMSIATRVLETETEVYS